MDKYITRFGVAELDRTNEGIYFRFTDGFWFLPAGITVYDTIRTETMEPTKMLAPEVWKEIMNRKLKSVGIKEVS